MFWRALQVVGVYIYHRLTTNGPFGLTKISVFLLLLFCNFCRVLSHFLIRYKKFLYLITHTLILVKLHKNDYTIA